MCETRDLPVKLRSYQYGQERNRTADSSIFSRVLYQQSYLAALPVLPRRTRSRCLYWLALSIESPPGYCGTGGPLAFWLDRPYQIGRASCRETREVAGAAGASCDYMRIVPAGRSGWRPAL